MVTATDATLVQKNVRNHSTWYEARLLSFQGEKYVKPRKVIVYISPKQLTIKEFVLKFIPKRLITFRLCPSTKVCFLYVTYYPIFSFWNYYIIAHLVNVFQYSYFELIILNKFHSECWCLVGLVIPILFRWVISNLYL